MKGGSAKVSRAFLNAQVLQFKSVLNRCRDTDPITQLNPQPKKEDMSRQQAQKYTNFIDSPGKFLETQTGPRTLVKETQTNPIQRTQHEIELERLVAQLRVQLQRKQAVQRATLQTSSAANSQEKAQLKQLEGRVDQLEHENGVLRKELARHKRADAQAKEMSSQLQSIMLSRLNQTQMHQEVENEETEKVQDALERTKYQLSMQIEENATLRLKISDLESRLGKMQLDKGLASVWTSRLIPPLHPQPNANRQSSVDSARNVSPIITKVPLKQTNSDSSTDNIVETIQLSGFGKQKQDNLDVTEENNEQSEPHQDTQLDNDLETAEPHEDAQPNNALGAVESTQKYAEEEGGEPEYQEELPDEEEHEEVDDLEEGEEVEEDAQSTADTAGGEERTEETVSSEPNKNKNDNESEPPPQFSEPSDLPPILPPELPPENSAPEPQQS